MDSDFSIFLEKEIEKKNWKQADLARAANLDSAVISMLLNGKRGPGIDTCTAIARALDLPIETVYRAAGILPPQYPETADIELLKYLAEKLPPEERQELIEIARMKLQKQKPPDINAKTPYKPLKAGENPASSV